MGVSELQPAAGWLAGGPGRAKTEPFVLFLRLRDEGREKGLSCSAGRPSRGCLAQLIGDAGCTKGWWMGAGGRAAFRRGRMAPECALSAPRS